MYSAEFDCMFYTYTLMGGIILIAIIMSNVFGFGIISSYHLSFEVTLQERVMRFQMQEKHYKWSTNDNKTQLFLDWIQEMNYVQEEYRLFTAYAEERKGIGEKGLKVTKISQEGTADNTVNQTEADDDSNYYQDTLDSVELLDCIPEGKTVAEMEEAKLKAK
jgi:arginyl-tRNA--protein-N-Asp/Glu arginylyltransferase